MDEKSFEAGGIIAIVLCIGALIVAKMFFPSLFVLMLWIIGIIIALIIILIGAVIYFAFKKPKEGTEEAEKSKASMVLSDGRTKIMGVRRNCTNIKNTRIKNAGIKVCAIADKILGVLRQKPDLIPKNRQFFTYYIPTLGSIIEKFERLEKNGISSKDTEEKVLEHLNDIESAFNKQYKSLFAGDMLDLSVEIEAMTIACKRDGLLTEEDFIINEEKAVDLEL